MAGFFAADLGGQSRRSNGRGRANGGRDRGRRQTAPADRGQTRAGEAAGGRAGQKSTTWGVVLQLFLIVSRGAGGLWARFTPRTGGRGAGGERHGRDGGHPHRRPRANRHRPRAGKRRPRPRTPPPPTEDKRGRGRRQTAPAEWRANRGGEWEGGAGRPGRETHAPRPSLYLSFAKGKPRRGRRGALLYRTRGSEYNASCSVFFSV